MHADQLSVSPEAVRALVDDQFPGWRSRPVRRVAGHGTVNAIFRVGARLAARFPLRPPGRAQPGGGERGRRAREVAATRRWLESEAEAARELLGRTRFRTPEPVAVGAPGAGYPLPWSVQTWLPGVVATDDDPGGSVAFGHDLAEFIAGVRAIDTRGRSFGGSGRGGDLPAHDAWMQTCFAHSDGLLDVPRLRRVWAVLRDLPRGPGADVMTHGDLIPGNVLVSRGRLAGVLDVGGLGPADPALDLVGAWHLLEVGPRRALRADLGCTDLEWERGRAWAFEQAVGAVWYYRDSNPAMSRMGRRTVQRILADAPPA
jgi:aminoglycoside phosphotransferase (APT) family kinase protein